MDCETNDCRKEKRGCKGCFFDEGTEITADEMFKELGYTIIRLDTPATIYCEYYNKKTEDIIQFWDDKTISKYNEDESDYITMQELQAINKKVEELGWK